MEELRLVKEHEGWYGSLRTGLERSFLCGTEQALNPRCGPTLGTASPWESVKRGPCVTLRIMKGLLLKLDFFSIHLLIPKIPL